MTLIQGTISGLKAASDIAGGFLKLKSIAEVQGKVIELQSAILLAQSSALAANSAQSEMVAEIGVLKEEITRLADWHVQKTRYKLIVPFEGSVTYGLKKSMSNGEPPHFICPNCYEGGKKSILNQVQAIDSRASLECPRCKAKTQSPWNGRLPVKYASE